MIKLIKVANRAKIYNNIYLPVETPLLASKVI